MRRFVLVAAIAGMLCFSVACGYRAVPGDAVAGAPPPTTSARKVAHLYDPARDAAADINAALRLAASDHGRVLIDFGADWCPACRRLHKLFEAPDVAALLQKHYHVVLVDIGDFDRNMRLAAKYIELKVTGIPALAVLAEDGTVLTAANTEVFAGSEAKIKDFLIRWAPKGAS